MCVYMCVYLYIYIYIYVCACYSDFVWLMNEVLCDYYKVKHVCI